MQVNLGRTTCCFCDGEVLLDEEPRRLNKRESDLLPAHLRHAIVANATCDTCSAKYVAWFETDTRVVLPVSALLRPLVATNFFRDLSHRSTMSSDPGEPDLPVHAIDVVRVKRTWPSCLRCGKRVFKNFGCQCTDPQLLRIVVRPLLTIPEWRDVGSAITTYDLFVPVPAVDAGDAHEWASLRGLIENAYLETLEEHVRIAEKDLADHYIEVALLPAGAYRGDDRQYHDAVEELVNRASLIVSAESMTAELTAETPIDGGAGPWVDPKRRHNMVPHRDEYHWLAAFAWAYSDLPHHLIHVMQEQVSAYREGRKEDQVDRWWVSLEDDKLVRPVAHFERDLPLGMQIGALYVADGAALVADDKRLVRPIIPARVIEIDDDESAPPDPSCDSPNWPAFSIAQTYSGQAWSAPPIANGLVKQFPNP